MHRFEHYINGNYMVIIDTKTGTKVRQNNLDHFDAEFPESFDLNISNKCDGGCPWCYQGCTPEGQHADLLSAKFLDTIHPFTEIAINGNDLSHPQLREFLDRMMDKHVIVSMTVNQQHFMKHYYWILQLLDEGAIHGLGISYTHYDEKFIERVKNLPSAVLHMIAGIHNRQDFARLSKQGLKVLILGYKTVGRGLQYVKEGSANYVNVMSNITDLANNVLPMMINNRWFDVLSFDNIAIRQLSPQKYMTAEEWNEMYMGDDGQDGELTSASMYIDLVSGKFARNSCELTRFDLKDDITEMYQFLKHYKGEKDCDE